MYTLPCLGVDTLQERPTMGWVAGYRHSTGGLLRHLLPVEPTIQLGLGSVREGSHAIGSNTLPQHDPPLGGRTLPASVSCHIVLPVIGIMTPLPLMTVMQTVQRI